MPSTKRFLKSLTSPVRLKVAIERRDRKSTRLNSSHQIISYAVFCLKKKNKLPPDNAHRYRYYKSYVAPHPALQLHTTNCPIIVGTPIPESTADPRFSDLQARLHETY